MLDLSVIKILLLHFPISLAVVVGILGFLLFYMINYSTAICLYNWFNYLCDFPPFE